MYPAIEIFRLPAIPSYTALLLLAVATCLTVGPRWARVLEGIDPRAARRALMALSAAALIGGRLHLVANYWGYYAERPTTMLKLWAGLHAGGAILAVTAAAPFIVRRYDIPLGKFADAIVPTSGIGIVLARLGCFLHGCCFGTPCPLPWCLPFPRGSESYQLQVDLGLIPSGAEHAVPVHPLQLYFAAVGLLITLGGLWLHARKRYDGQVALVALVLFSGSSAWLEFFRADGRQRVYWGPLPQLEWIALAMTAASLAALGAAEVLHRRSLVPVAGQTA